jgi:excisionase family DNA binding protein
MVLQDLISLAEASILSGLSTDHLRRLAEQGKLKARKVGRNWITTKESLTSYMEQRKPRGRPKTGLT